MKGLILKDLMNLRRYSRTIWAIIALYAVMMVTMDNVNFLGGMIILLFTMMSVTSFSYDSLAKWERYAVTLPLSRAQIVRSKYVLSLILALMGALISLIAAVVFSFFKPGNLLESVLSAYVLFIIALFFMAVLLPLIYKFGVEKSRIMIILVAAAPTAAVVALGQMGIKLPDISTVQWILYLSPVVMAGIYYLSYRISCGVFGKKDL